MISEAVLSTIGTEVEDILECGDLSLENIKVNVASCMNFVDVMIQYTKGPKFVVNFSTLDYK